MLQRRQITYSGLRVLFFFFYSHEAQVFRLLSLWGDILISLMKQVPNSLIVTIISIIVALFIQKMIMKRKCFNCRNARFSLSNFILWVVS